MTPMILSRWRKRLRAVLRKDEMEVELSEELAFHLEMETQKYIGAGHPPAEALRRAKLAFGSVESHKEQVRDARFFGWLDNLTADVRFTFRQYRRYPGATLTIVLVLALGIGVTCALFATSYSMLTQPATGIERDPSLMRIRGEDFRMQMLEAVERRTDLFTGVAAYRYRAEEATVETGESGSASFSARAIAVTPSYFPLLNVRTALGNPLPLAEDEAGAGTIGVVISHHLWQRHFDRSVSAIGRNLSIDGHPATIIGVAPEGFMGVDQRLPESAVWMSLSSLETIESIEVPRPFRIIARIRPGVSKDRVQAEVESFIPPEPLSSTLRPGRLIDVAPLLYHNQHPGGDRDTVEMVGLASILGILVLLTSCTNASGLLLGLAINRGREVSIRLSVGAGRRRVIRQFLTESVVLAAAAGILGVAVAWAFIAAVGESMPGLRIVADWTLIAFAALLATGVGVASGLSPALHATRKGLAQALRSESSTTSGTRRRLHSGLIVSQIALTQPLLLFLVLLLHVAITQFRDSSGRDVYEHIASVSVFMDSYGDAGEQLRQAATVRDHLTDLPGVEAASLVSTGGRFATVALPSIRGRNTTVSDSLDAWERSVDDGFFETLAIPLIAGRFFDRSDMAGDHSPVILGDEVARKLWNDENPLGQTIEINGRQRTVIGIVDESLSRSSESIRDNLVFSPAGSFFEGRFHVRTSSLAEPMLGRLQQEILNAAPGARIILATTFAASERESLRTAVRMLLSFGVAISIALLLSAVALTAGISRSVADRTKEVGIRSALGASRLGITVIFLRSGLRLAALGLTIGMAFSVLFHRLFVFQGPDALLTLPLTTAATIVGISVTAIALLATWLPARRAARLDPLNALKTE